MLGRGKAQIMEAATLVKEAGADELRGVARHRSSPYSGCRHRAAMPRRASS
jgi:3-deoxy-D-arabino-heptulosonate 7-phosphate (DAHP) synthase